MSEMIGAGLAAGRRWLAERRPRPARPPRIRPRDDWRERLRPNWGNRRTVAATALALVAVVVVAGVAADLTLSANPAPRGRAATKSPAGHVSTPTASPSAPPATTSPPATTTPPTTSPGSPGGPQIASISPAAGGPGQTVQLTGAGFFSSSGTITAFLNGQAAGTSCPSQTACTVTIPNLGGAPGTATLTIVTSGGTSNGVPFSYQ